MAEAYDTAMRRRLSTIDSMGSSATNFAQARMRQPGNIGQPVRTPGNFGAPMRYDGPGGNTYNGPRGNHDALINFGKFLQSQGFRISENSFFNGGHRITGGHTRNSKHYSDRAIDVNRYPGTSRREQQAIDGIVNMAKMYGLRAIWRQAGHYNHAHFDY